MVRHWIYRNAIGAAVTVCREDFGDESKRVWREPEGISGPWLPLDHGDLPAEGRIHVTEGEKDCDRLRELGYAATTFNGGAQSWSQTDWSCLKGREVVIVPDRDEPGRLMCSQLSAHLLNGVGATKVLVAQPPKKPGVVDGYNICDGTPEWIAECLDGATEIRIKGPVEWRTLDIPSTADVTMPEMMVPNLLETGMPSIMFGRPESGKSTLAILQAVALASGKGGLIGLGQLTVRKVGFVWCEESKITLTAKIRAIMETHGISDSDIEGQLLDLTGPDGADWSGNLAVSQQIPPIRDEAVRCGVECVFIDSLSAAAPEAETKNEMASHTANGLVDICRATGGSLMLIHHARKAETSGQTVIGLEEARGASAIYGKARVVVQAEKTNTFLDDAEKERIYLLHTVKANNFRTPGPQSYTMRGFHAHDDIWIPMACKVADGSARGPFSGISRQQAIQAWRALCDAPPGKRRKSDKAAGYAGKIVAGSLNIALNTSTGKSRVKAILKAWLDSDYLSEESFREFGQDRPIYGRGERNLAADDD